MNKPFTLIVQETEQKLIEVINNSKLPAYSLKILLKGIFEELERVDNEEIQKYLQDQEKEKESDK